MPNLAITCCNIKINCSEIWMLNDFRGFTNRQMRIGFCPNCEDMVVCLFQKRISDGKEFVSMLNGIKAVEETYRERKRGIVCKVSAPEKHILQEWVYGTNVEIRNKDKKVVKIRQYSTDFKTGAKKLEKEILTV